VRASIGPSDPSYPPGLIDISSPSFRLAGKLPAGPGVAIVGSRTASAEALEFTCTLAAELAASGVAIWSGGALGIDTAAHEGAVEAGKPTVVVLGSGLDCLYPEENVALFEKVERSGGALLSLFEDDAPAATAHFLKRNGVLAAATAMTLVIECDVRSGARSTAARAKRLRRPVGVVLQAPWSGWGAGCYAEYRQGATVIQEARDVLDVVAAGQQLSLFSDRAPLHQGPTLTDLERSVVCAVADGSVSLDDLCQALSLPAASVCVLVMDLTLRGHLVETSRGLRPGAGTGRTLPP